MAPKFERWRQDDEKISQFAKSDWHTKQACKFWAFKKDCTPEELHAWMTCDDGTPTWGESHCRKFVKGYGIFENLDKENFRLGDSHRIDRPNNIQTSKRKYDSLRRQTPEKYQASTKRQKVRQIVDILTKRGDESGKEILEKVMQKPEILKLMPETFVAQFGPTYLTNVNAVFQRLKNVKSSSALTTKNLLLAAGLTQETCNQQQVSQFFGVHRSTISAALSTREKFDSHEINSLLVPLRTQRVGVPHEVRQIILQFLMENSVADTSNKQVFVKSEAGKERKVVRYLLQPARDLFAVFCKVRKDEVLKCFHRMPGATFFYSSIPSNFKNVKIPDFGACMKCTPTIEAFSVFSKMIKGTCTQPCGDPNSRCPNLYCQCDQECTCSCGCETCTQCKVCNFPARLSDFIDSLLCNDKTWDCVEQNCKKCAVSDLSDFAKFSSLGEALEITFITYERVQYTVKPGRVFNTHKRLAHQVKIGEFLKDIFPAMLTKYIEHSFLYKNQNKAVDLMLDPANVQLPPHVLVWAFDYSRNPELFFEKMIVEQVKDRPQITLAPLLSYKSEMKDGIKSLGKKCTFYISEDNQHKSHMSMSIFGRHAEKEIPVFQDTLDQKSRMVLVVVTDGSPTELKNVELFNFWSKLAVKWKITILLPYFATAHGKYQYDPEGGLWKYIYATQCVQALKENSTNLEKIAEWFNIHHTTGKNSDSTVTSRETLVHGSVQQKNSTFKSIQGTRSNHCYMVLGVPGEIYMRKAFCYYCDSCQNGDFQNCTNGKIPPWKKVQIKSK